MRPYFSVKELGAILSVSPTKATQSLQPALRKMARLMLADPARGMAMLADAIEAERRTILAEGVDLAAMFRETA